MPTLTTTAELSAQLRVAVMRLARRLRSERSAPGVTLTQLAVLGTLERHGPLTPRELADHEKVQPPSMTRVVAALEEAGLVARTPHPSDRRQVLVAATPAALTMLREDRRRRDAWLSPRLAALSREERETLRAAVAILERVASA